MAAAALLATLLSSLAYVATGNIGLNLSDEGFLWYGVLRTLDGEIPLRDFQSYEPGRYYWCAAWALLLGDGLLALRLSVAIFQSLGLFCGLLTARRINTSPWFLMFTGTMLLLWMFPRYRAFESSIALIATYLGIRLVESPSVRQHFVAGVFVGSAAFFGRNHALYSALAFLALIVFLAVKVPTGALRPKIRSWILGIAVGIAPLMLMVVFVPGFALGYAESLIFFIRQGPNLPLDYPWPWNFGYLHLAWYERLCLAAAFLLPAVVLPLGAALTWSSTAIQVRQRAVVIAGTAVGIFFGHHVAVRSDAAHLAASIQPLLLTCLALPAVSRHTSRRLVKLCLWGSLGVITLPAVWSSNGIPERLLVDRVASQWLKREPLTAVGYDARGDRIYLDASRAEYLASLHRVIRHRVEPSESIFIAQAHPTLYALFDKVSPVWGIYFLWPAERSTQQEMI